MKAKGCDGSGCVHSTGSSVVVVVGKMKRAMAPWLQAVAYVCYIVAVQVITQAHFKTGMDTLQHRLVRVCMFACLREQEDVLCSALHQSPTHL